MRREETAASPFRRHAIYLACNHGVFPYQMLATRETVTKENTIECSIWQWHGPIVQLSVFESQWYSTLLSVPQKASYYSNRHLMWLPPQNFSLSLCMRES